MLKIHTNFVDTNNNIMNNTSFVNDFIEFGADDSFNSYYLEEFINISTHDESMPNRLRTCKFVRFVVVLAGQMTHAKFQPSFVFMMKSRSQRRTNSQFNQQKLRYLNYWHFSGMLCIVFEMETKKTELCFVWNSKMRLQLFKLLSISR